MDNFISNFNPDSNFWEENPQVKYISPFREFYKKDRTKTKDKSSQIMWAIGMYLEPVRSKLYRMDEELRAKTINENYLEGKDDFFKYQELLDAYHDYLMTPIKRNFKAWGDKLSTRMRFIEDTEYNEDTYEMLDKMMERTEKMMNQYKKLEEAFLEEELQTKMKGGIAKSAAEEGRI